MQIFHVKKVALQRVMPYIIDKKFTKKQKENQMDIDGFNVYFESLRLFTFKSKGCTCASCGREGTHFRVQQNGRSIHLGLWSDDNIQMTKDHIVPKSVGGFDHIDNMQTMCAQCNNRKGSKFDENDFINGKGKYSYKEALVISKEKKMDNIFHPDNHSSDKKSRIKRELLNKYPRFEQIEEKFRIIKSQRKDPFMDVNGKDVQYVLSYLADLIKAYEGKISKRARVLRLFPKKFIQAERNKYILKEEV